MPTTYAIPNGATAFAATTYTATGSTPQTITNTVNGVSFQPDLVWTKSRSAVFNNVLNDSVRGSQYYLYSNLTNAEVNDSTYLTAFNSNGFSLGAGNFTNGTTMIGWQWKAGGTSSSNTNGSITSTVSVNTTAGFSIVTYTGTGAAATVGHGLGVAPSFMINKVRNSGGTYDWYVYHSSLGNTSVLYLDLTSAAGTGSSLWNSTTPTSSVFSLGGPSQGTNISALTYVMYCWAQIPGYSAFGSYTGNGSATGPFVYLGFRPRWVMIKRTDTTSNWVILDTSRNVYNPQDLNLYPNLSAAEDDYTSTYPFDMLSNGIKFRANYANVNASGGTYIYACYAENPFKYANAR